jgi:hypothetical protein
VRAWDERAGRKIFGARSAAGGRYVSKKRGVSRSPFKSVRYRYLAGGPAWDISFSKSQHKYDAPNKGDRDCGNIKHSHPFEQVEFARSQMGIDDKL